MILGHLYYNSNKTLTDIPKLKQPTLHVKCRKVNVPIVQEAEIADVIIVERDWPIAIEDGFKTQAGVFSADAKSVY